MGSYLSAEKSAAKKIGCSLEEWRSRRSEGEGWCFRCRSWHPLSVFSIDKSRARGRTASCKACSSLASRASSYGMTVAGLRELLVRSGGRCELCGVDPERLYVDHNHATGKVRGVLCSSCNVGLGLFGDDPVQLRIAADYLERANG